MSPVPFIPARAGWVGRAIPFGWVGQAIPFGWVGQAIPFGWTSCR